MVVLDVVVDAHFLLVVMFPVQATRILLKRSLPGDWQRQYQGVARGGWSKPSPIRRPVASSTRGADASRKRKIKGDRFIIYFAE